MQTEEVEEKIEKLWESIRRGKKLINDLPRITADVVRSVPVLRVANPSESLEIYIRVLGERLQAVDVSDDYQTECWKILEFCNLLIDTTSRSDVMNFVLDKLNQVPCLLNWDESRERVFLKVWTSYSRGDCLLEERKLAKFLAKNSLVFEQLLTKFGKESEEYRKVCWLTALNKKVLAAMISIQKNMFNRGADPSNCKGVGAKLQEANPDVYLTYPPALQPALVLDGACRQDYICENVDRSPEDYLVLFLHFPEILRELFQFLRDVPSASKMASRILWCCFEVNVLGLSWSEICTELENSNLLKTFREEISADEPMELSQ